MNHQQHTITFSTGKQGVRNTDPTQTHVLLALLTQKANAPANQTDMRASTHFIQHNTPDYCPALPEAGY
jgi:hypothetical protein